MLSPEERDEIRREVLHELVEIEDDVSHRAGTYEYLCLVLGEPTFCHHPVGPVIRRIVHPECDVA
jgi:hypothetical protein